MVYGKYVLTPYLLVLNVESIEITLLFECLIIIERIYTVCIPMMKGTL